MKNRKLWMIAAAVVVAAAVLAGVYFAMKPNAAEGTKNITVTVVHQDGTEKTFQYTTEEAYLGAVLLGEGLVEGENGSYGLMIETVDGEKASWDENQSYWALYVGEDYATTGADTTPLTDGGVYKLVYTIG